MNISRILRSPQWVMGRRLALVSIVAILAIRNYGGNVSSWFREAGPEHDIRITQVEFRPDIGAAKPAWIIGVRNTSTSATYNQIELEATYRDADGKVLETDRLLLNQKLVPGDEQLVASIDHKSRPGAASGTLRVTGASSVTK